MARFATGMSSSSPRNPLCPTSGHRYAMVANNTHIAGRKISRVNIATPSDMSSSERFAGKKSNCVQIPVSQ